MEDKASAETESDQEVQVLYVHEPDDDILSEANNLKSEPKLEKG